MRPIEDNGMYIRRDFEPLFDKTIRNTVLENDLALDHLDDVGALFENYPLFVTGRI